IRRATEADREATRPLWEEFEAEVPEPAGWEPETFDEDWVDVARDIRDGAVYVAEDDDGTLVGIVRTGAPVHARAHVNHAYVRPAARRRGVAKELLRECVRELREKGARTVSLDVVLANEPAVAVWRRLGFAP